MKQLSILLSELRKQNNLSLRELSKAVGVSHTYLDSLEKGFDPRTGKTRNPTPDVLRTLSQFYNISYVELLILAEYITGDDIKGYCELRDGGSDNEESNNL